MIPKIAEIKEPHWKVGDGMDDPGRPFIVGQIAMVNTGEEKFEVRFYDVDGRERGTIAVRLDKENATKQ
jgi:hypothetical protein